MLFRISLAYFSTTWLQSSWLTYTWKGSKSLNSSQAKGQLYSQQQCIQLQQTTGIFLRKSSFNCFFYFSQYSPQQPVVVVPPCAFFVCFMRSLALITMCSRQVLSLGDSSATAAPIFLALLIVLLLFSFWPSPKKNWNLQPLQNTLVLAYWQAKLILLNFLFPAASLCASDLPEPPYLYLSSCPSASKKFLCIFLRAQAAKRRKQSLLWLVCMRRSFFSGYCCLICWQSSRSCPLISGRGMSAAVARQWAMSSAGSGCERLVLLRKQQYSLVKNQEGELFQTSLRSSRMRWQSVLVGRMRSKDLESRLLSSSLLMMLVAKDFLCCRKSSFSGCQVTQGCALCSPAYCARMYLQISCAYTRVPLVQTYISYSLVSTQMNCLKYGRIFTTIRSRLPFSCSKAQSSLGMRQNSSRAITVRRSSSLISVECRMVLSRSRMMMALVWASRLSTKICSWCLSALPVTSTPPPSCWKRQVLNWLRCSSRTCSMQNWHRPSTTFSCLHTTRRSRITTVSSPTRRRSPTPSKNVALARKGSVISASPTLPTSVVLVNCSLRAMLHSSSCPACRTSCSELRRQSSASEMATSCLSQYFQSAAWHHSHTATDQEYPFFTYSPKLPFRNLSSRGLWSHSLNQNSSKRPLPWPSLSANTSSPSQTARQKPSPTHSTVPAQLIDRTTSIGCGCSWQLLGRGLGRSLATGCCGRMRWAGASWRRRREIRLGSYLRSATWQSS